MTGSLGPGDDAEEGAAWLAVALEAARLMVHETSLRATAREIGMSPTGLRGLLDGTEPYGRTRERLRAWFTRENGLGEIPPEEAANIVRALLRGHPARHQAARSLLDHVEALYLGAGVGAPEWLPEVRELLAGLSR